LGLHLLLEELTLMVMEYMTKTMLVQKLLVLLNLTDVLILTVME
jgi:hypothetical protein